MKYCPVYEIDNNKFIIAMENFVGEDHAEAMKIGWGSMLVECVFWNINFTNEVIKVDPENFLHRTGTLKVFDDVLPVAFFEGPFFDEVS